MSINGIDSQQSYVSQSQQTQRKAPSADDMFKKLTQDVGGDGKTITKDQLESYIKNLESDTSSDSYKGKLGFLKQLDANFDKISGGSDSITSADLKSNIDLLKPPQGGPPPMDAAGGVTGSSSTSTSTLLSFLQNSSDNSNSRYDWQDPSTVTSDQLESPIDIKV